MTAHRLEIYKGMQIFRLYDGTGFETDSPYCFAKTLPELKEKIDEHMAKERQAFLKEAAKKVQITADGLLIYPNGESVQFASKRKAWQFADKHDIDAQY